MIGKVLGNRYEIIEQIGGGGMALVYKAKCRLLDRFVAIKILRDEFINDEEFIKKFRRESQAAASLSHPNIVNIYDVGVEEDGNKKIYYIVMEYIKGKTLKEVIKENGKLNLDEAMNISLQIAEALHHAHRNHIVHRDIKPHNIMITEDKRIKVTDFGIARAATSSTVTTTSNVLGSVHYFSPEQARGGYTDEKSDIYSLGIVMYEMLTGKLPFEGESAISVALKHVQEDIKPPSEVDATIPKGIESIILKCVQKRQGDRYNSIIDFIKDLRNIRNVGLEEVSKNIDNIDSPTRLIPIVTDEGVENMGKKKNKKKKSDGGLKIVFLAILLAFLLVTSIFVGYLRLKDFFVADEIIVPNIVGVEESKAKAEIEGLGLKFVVTGTVKSDKYPEGQVVTQNLEADSKVRKGFPIEVTISGGTNLVKVPNLANKTLLEAEALLKQNDLYAGISYEYHDTIPVNYVISQDPAPLTNVEPKSRVNIVISQGSEVKTVIMPKIVGDNIIDAKNTILSLDLEIGDVTQQPSADVPKDIVIWQSYEPGTELETKTAVDLYVSSGPEEPTPPVEETPLGEGNNDGDNVVEGPLNFTLALPQDVEETEVKINRRQDGATIVVYNKKHNASESPITITLYGKKGAEFDVIYNGIYQGTQLKEE